MAIPELEPHCGSWIITRKETGEAVAELFSRRDVGRVNADKFNIETAATYLARINSEARP